MGAWNFRLECQEFSGSDNCCVARFLEFGRIEPANLGRQCGDGLFVGGRLERRGKAEDCEVRPAACGAGAMDFPHAEAQRRAEEVVEKRSDNRRSPLMQLKVFSDSGAGKCTGMHGFAWFLTDVFVHDRSVASGAGRGDCRRVDVTECNQISHWREKIVCYGARERGCVVIGHVKSPG